MQRASLRCKLSLSAYLSVFRLHESHPLFLSCLFLPRPCLTHSVCLSFSISSSFCLVSSSRSYRLIISLLTSRFRSPLVSSLIHQHSSMCFYLSLRIFHLFEKVKWEKERSGGKKLKYSFLPSYNHRKSHSTFFGWAGFSYSLRSFTVKDE